MDPTLAWARTLFHRYYRREPVLLPPRFGRREFGFLFLAQKGMVRHTGFKTREELARFLAERGPAHAYYSVAYYEEPGASEMASKGWLGADLIFDLDADHLPGADEMTFEGMLEVVRGETVKVVEEFLLGHFGFAERDIRIAFSGGRGYHIHVTHPDVHPLDSSARREIVDYVTGNGLLVERFLERRSMTTTRAEAGPPGLAWKLPHPSQPGWGGLFTRTFAGEMERIASLDAPEAVQELEHFENIGKKTAVEIHRRLTREKLAELRTGNVDAVRPLTHKAVLTSVARKASVKAFGEADEPVTADVKRLIRLPGSLHGKTGLRVTPISVDGLKRFEPLRDAVALSDEPVAIATDKPVEVTLKDVTYALEPGRHEVPEHVAAFLVLRRQARIAPEVTS